MIKKIRLTNFFSFLDCEVNLQPDVNVLLGVNGSGKSNLIKAFDLLREGVSGKGLQEMIIEKWGGFDNIICKTEQGKEFPNSIGIEITLDGSEVGKYGFPFYEDILYKIIIIKKPGFDNYYISEKLQTSKADKQHDKPFVYIDVNNGEGRLHEHISLKVEDNNNIASESEQSYGKKKKTGLAYYSDHDPRELVLSKIYDDERYYEINTVRKALSDIMVYSYLDTTAGSRLRSAVKATGGKRLSTDGGNLPQILNTLKIKYKPQFKQLTESLQDVNEHFRGFDFNMLGSGMFELMLDENQLNSAVHITHVSDGTLRYLCQLAILFNPERGRLICIDEPETGLHPDMMHNLASAFQKFSENTMFLIATHHADIVDSFDLRNIRVFEKDDKNITRVNQFSEEDFKNCYDEFRTGDMWRKGDLGGNRW